MNLILKTIENSYFKKILIAILLILFARSVGQYVLTISGGFSLGSLVNSFIPCIPYLFLLVVVIITDFSKIHLVFEIPEFKTKHLLIIACLAIPLGFLTYILVQYIAMTVNMILIFIAIGTLLSILFSAKYNLFFGVIGFLAILPFISFVEWDIGQVNTEWIQIKIGYICLTPTIILLLILSFTSLITSIVRKISYFKIPFYKSITFLFVAFLAATINSDDFAISFEAFMFMIVYPLLFYVF